MKKQLLTFAAAGVMAAAMSFSAFAGEWKEDQTGWWYQNDDGSYLNNGWNWINGRSYYFTPEGYCLTDTTTPDGYTVDASGAWVVDGVVQAQDGQQAAESQAPADAGSGQAAGQTYSISGLTFTVPAGLTLDEDTSEANALFFFNDNHDGGVAVLTQDIPEAAQYGALLEQYGEAILDEAMKEVGTPAAKGVKQFPTGTWYCYLYNGTDSLNISVGNEISEQIYLYARLKGAQVQMVMVVGNTGISPDDIVANYLR